MEFSGYGIHPGDRCVFVQTRFANLVRKCYRWKLPLAIATLDISRAFATVPHYAVIRALEFHNTPSELIALMLKEIRNNFLEIKLQHGGGFAVKLGRGILEGSPLSMLLILVVQSMLLGRMMVDPAFKEHLMILPTAPNSSQHQVDPAAWVDDFVLTASSSSSLQSQVELISGLLGQLNMSVKHAKIHWMGMEALTAQEIFFERKVIRKASCLSILGLSIDSVGSSQHSCQQRRAAAMAKWYSMEREFNFRKLSKDVIFKLHNMVFVPSQAYGLAALPMATTLLQHLSSASTSHLLRYHRRPRGLELDVWIHSVRRDLRERRLRGEVISPLNFVAADLRAMFEHCQTARGAQLKGVLEWRDRKWLNSVGRQHRPQQRKGGDFTELQLLASELQRYTWLRMHVA